MRGSRVAGCIAILALASCARAYDEDAIPRAGAEAQLGSEQCKVRDNAHEFATVSAYAECEIATRQKFYQDIRFSEPALVEAYAQRIRLIAAQVDSGRYTREAFKASANEAEADLRAGVASVARIDAEKNQRAAIAFAAAGQSMQNAAAYQLPPPPASTYRPPVHCTSQAAGNYTYTNCY